MATLALNKKARFNYQIIQTYDAGLVLAGQEVKSVKAGQISLTGSFVIFRNGEAYLTNAHISPYSKAGLDASYNPERERKLLLTGKELSEISQRRSTEGLTVVPLEVFSTRNLVKIKIGLARGKRKYDKRETIKKRELDKKIKRTLNA